MVIIIVAVILIAILFFTSGGDPLLDELLKGRKKDNEDEVINMTDIGNGVKVNFDLGHDCIKDLAYKICNKVIWSVDFNVPKNQTADFYKGVILRLIHKTEWGFTIDFKDKDEVWRGWHYGLRNSECFVVNTPATISFPPLLNNIFTTNVLGDYQIYNNDCFFNYCRFFNKVFINGNQLIYETKPEKFALAKATSIRNIDDWDFNGSCINGNVFITTNGAPAPMHTKFQVDSTNMIVRFNNGFERFSPEQVGLQNIDRKYWKVLTVLSLNSACNKFNEETPSMRELCIKEFGSFVGLCQQNKLKEHVVSNILHKDAEVAIDFRMVKRLPLSFMFLNISWKGPVSDTMGFTPVEINVPKTVRVEKYLTNTHIFLGRFKFIANDGMDSNMFVCVTVGGHVDVRFDGETAICTPTPNFSYDALRALNAFLSKLYKVKYMSGDAPVEFDDLPIPGFENLDTNKSREGRFL